MRTLIVLCMFGCGATVAERAPEPTELPVVHTPVDLVALAYAREAVRRRFEWVLIAVSPTAITEPTEAEIAAYIAAHPEELAAEFERARHRYTDLDRQVRARHILIRSNEEDDATTRRAARARADALRRRALAHEDFATLARENSEDPGSAPQGGDLGYFPEGRMVAAFEQAVFALRRDGEIGPVVQTQFGFHVIQRVGTREGDIPFEGAAPELAEIELRRERAEAQTFPLAERAAVLMREGRPLEEIAAQLVRDGADGEMMSASEAVVRRGERTPFDVVPFELLEQAFATEAVEPVVLPATHAGIRSAIAVRVVAVEADPNGLTPEVRACLSERIARGCGVEETERCERCVPIEQPAPFPPDVLEMIRRMQEEQGGSE